MLKHGQRKYELIGTVGMAAIAMLCAPLAMAKKPSGADLPFSKDHLVYVDFDKPNDTDGIPMVSRSNWPLGITITIPYDTFWTGEGKERGGVWLGGWRRGRESNYIFFEAADNGCWYPEDGLPRKLVFNQPCAETQSIENPWEPPHLRYIEFAADIDLQGTPDGENDSRSDLREDIGLSELGVIDAGLTDEVESGWGIGTDDDLPSLFLYAEVGSGFVWRIDDDGKRQLGDESGIVGVRNLAGLSTSVSYSESILNKIARSQEVEIHSVIQAPKGLLDPVIEVDTNPDQTDGDFVDKGWRFTDEGLIAAFSNDSFKWRVDGGPVEPMPESGIVEMANTIDGCVKVTDVAGAYLISTRSVTIKAFVVSGTAPSELFDENGDGNYVDDAIKMGHDVLSNVAEVELLIDPLFDVQFGGAVMFEGVGQAEFFKSSFVDLDGVDGETPPEGCGGNGATYIRREPR